MDELVRGGFSQKGAEAILKTCVPSFTGVATKADVAQAAREGRLWVIAAAAVAVALGAGGDSLLGKLLRAIFKF
jgi:hypothetical protein